MNDGRIEKLWPLLVAGVLLLGGCAGNIHTRVTEDLEVKTEESTTQVQWTRNGHTTELTMQGDVTIAGSLDDIQSVPADGHFELTETNGRTQRLRVVPAEGTAEEDRLSYRYTVDGQSQSFGKEERRWLRRTLHEVARKTGIGVEQRVAYLFEKGGGDAVFEEVQRIDSDLGARHYYSALVRLEAAPMTVADRALRRATHRLDSDYQMRQLLEDAADRYADAAAYFETYAKAARTIDSDYQRRQMLAPLVARTDLTPAQHRAVLKLIAGIDSDYQKRQVLTALSPSSLTGAHADTFSRLLGMIDSDYQKRQALAELLGRDDLPANLLETLLKQVESIDSDYQKRQVLTALTPSVLPSAHADTFSRLLGTIDSDYQKRQAFAELLEHDDLPATLLVALLEQVRRMESGRDKTELLREAEHLRTHDDPTVRKAYRTAVMSIVTADRHP